MKSNLKVYYFLGGMGLAFLGILIPYPASALVALLGVILMLYCFSTAKMILGGVISSLIVLMPIAENFAIEHMPWKMLIPENFKGDFKGMEDGSPPRDFELLEENGEFHGVRYLSIYGKGIELILKSDSDLVNVESGLYYKEGNMRLEIFSKKGGEVQAGRLEYLEIDGMNIKVEGESVLKRMSVQGLKNSLNISVSDGFRLEINGMGNLTNLSAKGDLRVEVNGMNNTTEIDMTSAEQGEVSLEVNGVSNKVRIILLKDSKVFIKSVVEPSMMNDVEIIRR